MDNKNDNRFPLRLDDLTRWKIESWYKQDNCQSRNEFVVKAVNFYADFLSGQVNGVLPTAIQSAIDGRLGMFEDRLARLLYKLAVETDMGISAVLDCIRMDSDYLRRLRADSVKNVKATNGLLTYEQKRMMEMVMTNGKADCQKSLHQGRWRWRRSGRLPEVHRYP